MAEEYLGINTSTLNAIASSIKTKGGTNANLSFPEGMVQALQNIETEATVTPKISSFNTVLDSNNPSIFIEQGYHSGLDTVSIELVTGSAAPTNSSEAYYPPAGKLYSSFSVGGIGNGYRVAIGFISGSNSNVLDISDASIQFTPVGTMGCIIPSSALSSYNILNWIKIPNQTPNYPAMQAYSSTSVRSIITASSLPVSYSYGKATLTANNTSYKFNGTFFYVVWG